MTDENTKNKEINGVFTHVVDNKSIENYINEKYNIISKLFDIEYKRFNDLFDNCTIHKIDRFSDHLIKYFNRQYNHYKESSNFKIQNDYRDDEIQKDLDEIFINLNFYNLIINYIIFDLILYKMGYVKYL